MKAQKLQQKWPPNSKCVIDSVMGVERLTGNPKKFYRASVIFTGKVKSSTKIEVELTAIRVGPLSGFWEAELKAFSVMREALGFRVDNLPHGQYRLLDYLFANVKSPNSNSVYLESELKPFTDAKYRVDMALVIPSTHPKFSIRKKGATIELQGGIFGSKKYGTKAGHNRVGTLRDIEKQRRLMLDGWIPYQVPSTIKESDYPNILKDLEDLFQTWFGVIL